MQERNTKTISNIYFIANKMTSAEPILDAADVAVAEENNTVTTASDDTERLENKEDDKDAVEEVQVQEEKKDNEEECANNDENKKILRRSSSSFMRAHDLDIPEELQKGGSEVASSALQELLKSTATRLRGPDPSAAEGMFYVDQDLALALDQLVQLGFCEATDESARFVPGRETTKVLKLREANPIPVEPEWPISNWSAANPANLNEVLIWNGMVNSETNKGFGADWPVIKARGIIPTSPREMVDFLWDSKNVPRYNNMSQGREDVLIWQNNVDTKAEDSPYGFPGCAKVMKSYNKIKMIPRLIETVSILHARPLEPSLAVPGTYIVVNRSVWETDEEGSPLQAATDLNNKHKVVRSEMFLGVQLLRPILDGKATEMTTIAHASAPGVNKTMAKTAANVSAAKIIRDIQALHM